MAESIKEACGIFGIYCKNELNAAKLVYYGLYALQHRGQESCGIAINNNNKITCVKDVGLVSDVFNAHILDEMRGSIAVGHVRYSNFDNNTRENAQPLCANYVKGTLTIAHNGNIANAEQLRRELMDEGAIFQSTNDSEVIAFLIAKERTKSASIEEAVSKVMPRLLGSYSLIVMSPRKLIAVRDPYGIRPLCIGKIDDSYIFSSESCALDAVQADFVRDVQPGEIVVISPASLYSLTEHCTVKSALCIFEHIYFARPDSVIDGVSVYEARKNGGKILAKRFPVEADIVIGAPESGIVSAIGYAEESKIPYSYGLIKNRYISRTFIKPGQDMRADSVAIKLNVLKHTIAGKCVVVIDDSIVRGTTMMRIIKILRDAGAKEVHVRISSPPFSHPCHFGTDISNSKELTYDETKQDAVEILRQKIGADSLCFLPKEELNNLAPNSKLDFCIGCFTGKYAIPVDKYLQRKQSKHIIDVNCTVKPKS
ncbi:MAG: amidophosphoribosyltransferase [Christensenellales bacterium]|jgi:amidophosphoribosyltransferase